MARLLGPSLALLAALCCSCVYARLDGSTEPGRAFERPERIAGWDRYARLAADHPGDSALLPLGDGLDAFAARVMIVDGAERAIDAQYYIYRGDDTGRFLLHRMLVAADRGVRVRLLLDDVGTKGVDDLIAAANAHPGVEVRLFNPYARGPWPWLAKTLDFARRPLRLNRRMHNKLLSMDGLTVVVGGRNVGDEYFDAAELVNFGDLDLLAFGPVALEAGASFDLYWNSSLTKRLDGWKSFRRGAEDLEALRHELAEDAARVRGSVYAERLRGASFVELALREELPLVWAPAHVVSDVPWKILARGDEVEETMLTRRLEESIPTAERDLLIVSPYFVPRKSGTEMLCRRVAEGARVRVLTNSLAATDVPIVHAGYARYREPLVEGGVELYELMPTGDATAEAHRRGLFGSKSASLHAKTYVVDERHVFVGSLNFDPRSIDLNTELGLVVDSPELASDLVRRAERLLRPAASWRLRTEDGDLRWHGERDGESRVLTSEPGAGWWTRFELWWLGLLPIEGQL